LARVQPLDESIVENFSAMSRQPALRDRYLPRSDRVRRFAGDRGRQPSCPVALDDPDAIRGFVDREADGVLQTANRAALDEEVGGVADEQPALLVGPRGIERDTEAAGQPVERVARRAADVEARLHGGATILVLR